MPDQWYYSQNGQRKGPVDAGALKALADAGVVQPDSLVWREGMPDWEPAFRHVPGLAPNLPGGPPPIGGAPAGRRDYHEQVGMGEAVRRFFARYFDFSGRSNRGEYWWWILASIIVSVVLSVIDTAAFGSAEVQPLSSLWGLATFIPSIALAVRRLHDIDRTGWWVVAPVALAILGIAIGGAAIASGNAPGLAIVVLAAALVMGLVLLVWACQRGTSGPNRFG